MVRLLSITLVLQGFVLAEQMTSTVRFMNGDQLTGEVLEFSPEALSWSSVMLLKPAVFPIENVLDVTLAPSGNVAERQGSHEATLHMTNGDVFYGQLAGVNDEFVSLDTWYAGNLTLRTVNVREVTIRPADTVVYQGPNSMDEWTMSDGSEGWLLRDGALETKEPAGIGMEIDFPTEFQIRFTAEWRGNFRPKVVLMSNDIRDADPDSGYTMVFQGNSVLLRRSGSDNWLGRAANANRLRENEKADILIQVSKKTGQILLFVDDERIHLWEDEDFDADELGNGFQFVAQGQTPLRISDLEVTEWDGYVEDLDPQVQLRADHFGRGGDLGITEPSEKKVEEGRMVLRNGDSMKGEITGVEDGVVTVKTEFSEVKIPIERLHNLVLQESKRETPKRNKGDVRAHLRDGSRIVFRIDAVSDGHVEGFSQNFGTAKFTRDAFEKIEFNIYPRFGEKRPTFSTW